MQAWDWVDPPLHQSLTMQAAGPTGWSGGGGVSLAPPGRWPVHSPGQHAL